MRARRRKPNDPAADAAPTDQPDTPESATPLFDVVARALAEREWRWEPCGDADTGRPAASLTVRGPHTAYDCVLSAHEPLRQVLFTATLPARLPRERLGAVCEAVARANWGLTLAAFELHLDEGALRVRAGADVEGGALAVPMVHALVDTAFQAFEWYYAAFMRVAYGAMAPADAILEVELGMLPGPTADDA